MSLDQSIQNFITKVGHLEKIGETAKAEQLKKAVKTYLESKGYEWQTNPHLAEILGECETQMTEAKSITEGRSRTSSFDVYFEYTNGVVLFGEDKELPIELFPNISKYPKSSKNEFRMEVEYYCTPGYISNNYEEPNEQPDVIIENLVEPTTGDTIDPNDLPDDVYSDLQEQGYNESGDDYDEDYGDLRHDMEERAYNDPSHQARMDRGIDAFRESVMPKISRLVEADLRKKSLKEYDDYPTKVRLYYAEREDRAAGFTLYCPDVSHNLIPFTCPELMAILEQDPDQFMEGELIVTFEGRIISEDEERISIERVQSDEEGIDINYSTINKDAQELIYHACSVAIWKDFRPKYSSTHDRDREERNGWMPWE